MQVTLIPEGSTMIGAEEHIGRMAAECYDSDTSAEACQRRAIKCRDSGHLATMRFAFATFDVQGVSRICSHQIVRMAHAGILQRSQRYVRETGVQFVTPHSFEHLPPKVQERWEQLQAESRDFYNHLLTQGVKKEDARYALLHSAETGLKLCLNFQGWQDFLRNRMDKAAQWEVREVALEINRQLHTIAPNLFLLPQK